MQLVSSITLMVPLSRTIVATIHGYQTSRLLYLQLRHASGVVLAQSRAVREKLAQMIDTLGPYNRRRIGWNLNLQIAQINETRLNTRVDDLVSKSWSKH